MRKILKITLFAILAGLFMMPVYVSAQEKTDNPGSAKPKKTDESPKKTEETPKKTVEPDDQSSDEGIKFPEIEGWEKGGIRTYPNAALGYSVGYQSEDGGTITVYVYNAGLKKIPTDINDKILIDEIERAKNDIIQIGKMGVYENVKELKNDRVTLGGANGKVKALRSLYYFKVRGNEVDSEIYLFSYKNNFIKIRSTRPKSEDGKENKAVMDLLAEMDKLFAK